jgi:lipoate-protein ligase A
VTWPVERVGASAAELHRRGVSANASRVVEVLEASAPALVLGSTQRDDVADAGACRAAGVEVARRRSGGGVVLVDESVLWVDVVLPVGDVRWEADVSRSAAWLGATWCAALRDVGAVDDPVVHTGSMCITRWGRLVCFAGLGPGEVTAGAGGPKVVGISQRRTREGARFQCAVLFGWDAARLVSLLHFESADDRDAAASDLAGAGVVHPVAPALREPLFAAFTRALPA